MKAQDPQVNDPQSFGLGDEQGQDAALQALRSLQEVPPRSLGAQTAGKTAFLAEARSLAQAVSPSLKDRLKGWMKPEGKEAKPMIFVARVALVLGLLLGGTGATAAAAQASSPTDLLYPVKLATEDVRLALTTNAAAEYALLLGMVDERVEEIQRLAMEGIPVPTRVNTRLHNQLQMMLQRAAELDDPSLVQAMEQLQVRTQEHIRLFQNTRENASENAEEALQLAEQIMANIRVQAEGALEDPTTFRLRLNTARPDSAADQPDLEPGQGDGSGESGNSEDCEPIPGGSNECVPFGPGNPQGEGKQRGKED